MKHEVYTHAEWCVCEGKQKEFIEAWKELGVIFGSLPDPPGRGTLVQSSRDANLFYSFGPWSCMEAVEAMRQDHRAQEGIRKLLDLCVEASPGAYRVVAESP